jgi:hypothetical protein
LVQLPATDRVQRQHKRVRQTGKAADRKARGMRFVSSNDATVRARFIGASGYGFVGFKVQVALDR